MTISRSLDKKCNTNSWFGAYLHRLPFFNKAFFCSTKSWRLSQNSKPTSLHMKVLFPSVVEAMADTKIEFENLELCSDFIKLSSIKSKKTKTKTKTKKTRISKTYVEEIFGLLKSFHLFLWNVVLDWCRMMNCCPEHKGRK